MNWKERILLILLAALNFTHILDFMIMMPLGNYLMPYFKINPQQFTLLVSAYTISAAVSGFTAAFYVDGFDRKKVLLAAYSGFLLGTIGCGLAPTFYLLLFARTFAGIFGGLIGAQVLAIIADSFPYERRGAAMGAIMSAFAIASTFGVPFALYLANLFSWHAPFLLVGTLGLLLIPMIVLYLPPMTGHLINENAEHRKRWTIITDILKEKTQYTALIFSGLIMFGHFLIIPFINPFMEFNIGFSKNITPLIYLVGGVSAFFSSNILGPLSDRYGKLSIFMICTFSALPMIFLVTNLPHGIHYIPVLILFGLWFTVATGRGVTAGAMVTSIVSPAHRGSFQSFNSSLQQLGTGMASLVTGFIVIKDPTSGRLLHYDWVGYLSIAVLMVCIYIAYQNFSYLDKQKKEELRVKKIEGIPSHDLSQTP
jgi:predicted MFS family arabinose efflux permease